MSRMQYSKTMLSHWHIPLVVFLVGISVGLANAQEDSSDAKKQEEKKKPDVEMLECTVEVVDPDGHAIEDATIYCTGLRSKEERGSHWGWRDDVWGKAPKIKTDAEGMATMPYPKMLTEEHTTGTMTWSVEHPDFVNYREDHSVDAVAKVEMERGFRIALTAKHTDGEKIQENLHAVVSFAGGGNWELKKNGMLVSSVMKKQDGIMRVVCFEEGKPTLFSKEVDIKPGDKSRLLLKDIELSIGCRLEGTVSESVTRPVKNGYVIACVSKHTDSTDWNSEWSWTAETSIKEDGTFVFESLPSDVSVQLLPVCDDWVPEKPKPEEVIAAMNLRRPEGIENSIEHFSASPHVFRISKELTTVELPMVRAAKVTIQVVDQDGKPVSGANVGSSPNQFWFNSGSQIYGSSYPARKIWELRQAKKDLGEYFRAQTSPYGGKTNEEGVFVIKNMPPGYQRIYAMKDGMEMAKDPMSQRRVKRVQVRDTDRNVTVKLFPKGSLPDTRNQRPLGEQLRALWTSLTETDN